MTAPVRRAVSARTYTPTLDRLPVEARSVLVPGIVAALLVLLAVGVSITSTLQVTSAIGRSDVLADVGEIDRSLTPRQIQECEERLDDLADARRDHIARTGEVPDRIGQIAPGATDVVLGPDGRAVPAPGSLCEGVVDGEVTTVQALDDRRDAAAAELEDSISPGLLVLGALAGLAAPGMLSWWLASAYRALPRSTRHRPPSRAYAVVRSYAVVVPLVVTTITLLTTYLLPDHLDIAALILSLVVLGCTVALIRAVLIVISMIGDVTFEFCHRHYGTSRAMRLSVLAYLLIPFALAAIGFLAVTVETVDWAVTTLDVVARILGYTFYAAPVVFTVSLVVSVVMASLGIDRALAEAAEEANRAEADERARMAAEHLVAV